MGRRFDNLLSTQRDLSNARRARPVRAGPGGWVYSSTGPRADQPFLPEKYRHSFSHLRVVIVNQNLALLDILFLPAKVHINNRPDHRETLTFLKTILHFL